MGIKGLNKIINQHVPEAIYQSDISNFKGSKVAIDSELLLHKFRSNESVNSHVFGFIINIFWYLKNGIIPVYVFDGSPNAAKQNNAIRTRSTYKEQLYQKAGDIESKLEKHSEYDNNGAGNPLGEEFNTLYDKLYKIQKKMTCMSVSKKHRNECKYLLKLMGVPYIIANDDAEAYCVYLQRQGHVDYVYTEDTDVIPYYIASVMNDGNINKPIKYFKTTNYSKNPYNLRKFSKTNKFDSITVVDVSLIINKLGMSNESFIDMCILCGCDYCPQFPKINHEKAFNYIKKYETIENFINSGVYVPPDFKYKEAREIFYLNNNINLDKPFCLEQFDNEGLKKYLSEEREINDFLIMGIISQYNEIKMGL
jgi:flap endonuclease-1